MLLAEGGSGRPKGYGHISETEFRLVGWSLQKKRNRAGVRSERQTGARPVAGSIGGIRSLVLTPKAIEACGGF